MSRRPRGRGRKPQHNSNHNKNPNRSLDSNGPDVRVRGSAKTIYDKYTSLAHDASVSGHRVKAESYLQHAEHYFRILQEIQEKAAAKADLHQKEQARIQAQKQEQQAQKQEQQAQKQEDQQAQKQEQADEPHADTDAGDKSASRSRSYLNRRRPNNGQDTESEAKEPSEDEAPKPEKPVKRKPRKPKEAKPVTENEPAAAE
ncbi:MAG: DUF4167 domain-containing protein [Robiginitomaculum sp.]|nr:DUF4167 domain-containing protein [Robiginitomaculum sp.]